MTSEQSDMEQRIIEIHAAWQAAARSEVRLSPSIQRAIYDAIVKEGVTADEVALCVRWRLMKNKGQPVNYHKPTTLPRVLEGDKLGLVVSEAAEMKMILRQQGKAIPTARADAFRATGRSDQTNDGQVHAANVIPIADNALIQQLRKAAI